jgi:hypothetical protein
MYTDSPSSTESHPQFHSNTQLFQHHLRSNLQLLLAEPEGHKEPNTKSLFF